MLDTGPRVRKQTMRDFVGLEKVNEETRKVGMLREMYFLVIVTNSIGQDLLRFSFHLTTGNLDEAYRAVKRIQSVSVWENMLQMCIKTKRFDVAEVCLGNLNHARAARALRQSKVSAIFLSLVAILSKNTRIRIYQKTMPASQRSPLKLVSLTKHRSF